jgi:hypothetical protein
MLEVGSSISTDAKHGLSPAPTQVLFFSSPKRPEQSPPVPRNPLKINRSLRDLYVLRGKKTLRTRKSSGVLQLAPGHEADFDSLFESRGNAAENRERMTIIVRVFEA